MAVSIVGALFALFALVRGGVSLKVAVPALTMLASRAMAVYTTFTVEVTTIGRAMQQLLYERTVASQQAVISSLTEDMAK